MMAQIGGIVKKFLTAGFLGLLAASASFGASFSLLTSNSPNATYPYLGGIRGFASTNDNIGAGSSNYVFLGGTLFSASGLAAQPLGNSFTAATSIPEDTESSIWTLGSGNVLTPNWVNTDLSVHTGTVMFLSDTLIFTGDPTAFQATFGPAEFITLTYVAIDGSTGHIDATDSVTHADLGFVAASFNQFGEYHAFTRDTGLIVAAPTPEPSTAGLLSLGLGLSTLIGRRLRNRLRA
jgi:hypothetical protein